MEDVCRFDPVAWINTPRWQTSRLGLSRMVDLLERLGRPQDDLRFVHVAGTNGKGSVCAYLASVLQAAGYKVGLFTSPFILCFEERIRVNGENIRAEELARAVQAELESRLKDYLAQLVRGKYQKIYYGPEEDGPYSLIYNRVLALLLSIEGVENFSALTVNGTTADVMLQADQVPVLKEVSVT